jgi:hypothetical protein
MTSTGDTEEETGDTEEVTGDTEEEVVGRGDAEEEERVGPSQCHWLLTWFG